MGLLGLFKKEKDPQWVVDVKSVVEILDGLHSITKLETDLYSIYLGDNYNGLVWKAKDGALMFKLKLDNLRDLAREKHLSPEFLYDRFTRFLDYTSVAVDEDFDMHVSTYIEADDYDPGYMAEVLGRWPVQLIDYKGSLEAALDEINGGVQ